MDKAELGEAALDGLLDRSGIGDMLQSFKYDDPELWQEICEEAGENALAALAKPQGTTNE